VNLFGENIRSKGRSRLNFLVMSALLIFAVCVAAARAQSAPAVPTALDLAKRVDDHYNHLQSLKASFNEQYDGLGMHRSESGVMMLRKPGRMRWEYQSTAGKVFVLDGKYAWFYAPSDTQVQRIAASQLDDLRSPLRFLLGHTKIESELEGLKIAPIAQTGKSGNYTLTGVPKGQQKRLAKLSLTITPTGAIQDIVIDEVDGARTQFEFSNEEPNAVIPESLFHFAPPAGVPVVDALPPV
jgi:outer membrane lipoprotein carrier protein